MVNPSAGARDSADAPDLSLTKASLACASTLETIDVLWNPARYRIERRNLLETPALVGGADALVRLSGRIERFETPLFLDTTDRHGEARDARRVVDRLVSWMGRSRDGLGAARSVVFIWGDFRFAGVIEAIEEEWTRFDPDGAPVRGWLTLVLLRQE